MKKPRNKILETLQAIWYFGWVIAGVWLFGNFIKGCEQQQEDEALGRSIRTG